MDPFLKLQNRLRRIRNDFAFQWKFEETYRNYCPEHGLENWKSYDDFTIAFTSLKLDYLMDNPLHLSSFQDQIQPHVPGIYEALLDWTYGCSQVLRFFPPRFFRHAELVHGTMSIYSERLRIMVLLHYLFKEIKPMEELEDYQPLHVEAYFLKEENKIQRVDRLVFFLVQESFVQKEMINFLLSGLKESSSKQAQELKKIVEHYHGQVEFYASALRKVWELDPELFNDWECTNLPRLHYLERFPTFARLASRFRDYDESFLQNMQDQFEVLSREYGLGNPSHDKIEFSRDFELEEKEKSEYARLVSNVLSKFRGSVSAAIDAYGVENDQQLAKSKDVLLKESFQELFKSQNYKDQFQTSVYEAYTTEMGRIQWNLQDVLELVEKNPVTSLTDNDYQLIDVVKEIAFCEGFSYTIGCQNAYHVNQMNPFAIWNTNQCHEELKHYHAVRALLNKSGIQTRNLDEEFLASTFVQPTAEAYQDQYIVFMVNFLGEIHNMRAYWLLHEAFDNPTIKKVLEWIFNDEVVHKKIFGLHFKFLTKQDPTWAKSTYECILDHGLGIHQAMRCPRFKELMMKIGRYYARSGKTTALDFLNKSFRAQYLELKNLFDEDLFQLSEYEFRKRHLKAYLF